jgi:hypothetical protein
MSTAGSSAAAAPVNGVSNSHVQSRTVAGSRPTHWRVWLNAGMRGDR